MPSDWSVSVGKQAKGKFQKENIRNRSAIREPWRLWLHMHWQGCFSLLSLGSCSPQLILSLLPFPVLSPLFVQLHGEQSRGLGPSKNEPPERDPFPFWLTSDPATGFAGIAEVMMWERDCAAEERRSCWRKPNQPHRGVTFWGSESCVWLSLHHTALSLVVCLCYWKNVV